jgi:phage/plasmid primase-like uncharacterized protein/RecA-family ATPase
MMNPIEQFREFGRANGFELPAEIKTDRKIKRFSANGKRGDDAARYVLHLDGVPNGWIEDMRTGRKVEWKPSGKPLTAKERAGLAKQIEGDSAQREAETAEKRARAAREAERIWEDAAPGSEDHPYLVRKGIKPHGVCEYKGEITKYQGCLVIPVERDGELVGLQFIAPDNRFDGRDKTFLSGTPKQGNSFIIGEQRDVLCICEGFATAASVHEATGHACAVAFDCGNLMAVAKALEGFPGEIIICADDDWKRVNQRTGKPENIGLISATEAAAAIGARLAVPAFPGHRGEKDTDFNDLARLLGPGCVRECIQAAKPVEKSAVLDDDLDQGENVPKESGCDIAPICAGTLLRKPAPPRRWLMPGWMPEGQVTLFAGDGGVGKSTFALQLAMSAAIGAPLFGIEIVKTRTLILSAEDDTNEMHYRLEKILDGLAGDREANRAALEGNFWLLDATDQLDPTLATYDDESGINPSETFSGIAEFIRKNGIGLFIADSAADVFAEEINRHAVRSFIRQLKKIGCTVLLLGHPSVDGMRTGRGYSGSTHWSNSVRSRLYFQQAKTADGSEPDPDLRVLEIPKTNRARAGQKIFLRWTENGFAREDSAANDIGALADKLKAEEVFLKLLRKFIQEGRAPSGKPSSTYAPKAFAKHPESEGISKDAFAKTMDRLLSAGKIEIVKEGSPSKPRWPLRLKEAA